MPPDLLVWGLFSWWRYRTRTAAEATAACGGNREPRLGPRSDFSKPCQGAAEKSANATRTGTSRQIPSRFPTPRNVYRDDCRFVVDGTGLKPGQTKAGYPHEGGILPFAIFNSVWYTQLSSTNREHINLSTCFLRPSCKADRGLSSTTFRARTANTLPWEGSADTPFVQ